MVGDERLAAPRTDCDGALTVTAGVRGGAVVVVAAGEVDLGSAPLLARYLFEALSGGSRHLVADLSEVDFLGSAGLQELVVAQQQANDSGVLFSVVVAEHAARRAIEVTGLDEVLQLYPSLHDALPSAEPAG